MKRGPNLTSLLSMSAPGHIGFLNAISHRGVALPVIGMVKGAPFEVMWCTHRVRIVGKSILEVQSQSSLAQKCCRNSRSGTIFRPRSSPCELRLFNCICIFVTPGILPPELLLGYWQDLLPQENPRKSQGYLPIHLEPTALLDCGTNYQLSPLIEI